MALEKIVFDYFLSNKEPNEVAKPIGCIVKIDEYKFGQRKHHRFLNNKGKWVFGGTDRQTDKVFLVLVEKQNQKTLITIKNLDSFTFHNSIGSLKGL